MKINLKMNKRGFFLTAFFAFIAIALIFALLFVSAKMSSTFSENKGGLIVYDEDKVEIGNVLDYMDEYVELTDARFLVAGGGEDEK